MTPLPTQLLTVENRSSVVSATDLYRAVWATAYQLKYHYGRSPWVKLGIAPPASMALLKEGTAPPPGAWNLVLLDHSEEAGTLGFHSDEEGTKVPFSDVFCKDALAGGMSVSGVLSHEALEMVVDPHVETPYVITQGTKLFIVEVCDPVQGNNYDVGAPENREVGVDVSDFCEPAWWAKDGTGPFSFRESVHGPLRLAPEGYISVATQDNPTSWQPVFGEKISELPKWASRLPVIHAANS